jgi:hypothetical protein
MEKTCCIHWECEKCLSNVDWNTPIKVIIHGSRYILLAGRPGDRGSIPGRGEKIFPLASVSRPALVPTQSPAKWVPGVLSPGLKHGHDETLTTHPHSVPRSRMSRSYTPSPPRRLRDVQWDSFTFRRYIYPWCLNNHHTMQHSIKASGKLHAPADLTQGYSVPIEQKAGWAQETIWTLWLTVTEHSFLPEIEPRSSSP